MRPVALHAREALGAPLALALAGMVATGLFACGSGGGRSGWRTVEPGVRGTDVGVELRWWVVPDALALGEALDGLGPPAGLPERTEELWRSNGLQILSVPVDRVDSIEGRIKPVGGVHREWLSARADWLDAVRGPALPGGGSVLLDSGVLDVEPGRFALLARCWAEAWIQPDQPASARVRVELAPQFRESREEARLSRVPSPFEPPRPRRIEDEGLVLSRLALEMVVTTREAVVIVPGPAHVVSTTPTGPPTPTLPSLGEALLSLPSDPSTWGTGAPQRGARAVLVIIPSTPEGYTVATAPRER